MWIVTSIVSFNLTASIRSRREVFRPRTLPHRYVPFLNGSAATLRVLLGDVVDFDVPQRQVILSDGAISYDTLIVAAGAGHHYFGHADWETLAPSLKTVDDATAIRRRVLSAFRKRRSCEPDPERRGGWLTFVIVGAGPTGVELAGAIAELSRHTLRNEFRAIDPASARIILVDGLDRVLPTYLPTLSAKAAATLGPARRSH